MSISEDHEYPLDSGPCCAEREILRQLKCKVHPSSSTRELQIFDSFEDFVRTCILVELHLNLSRGVRGDESQSGDVRVDLKSLGQQLDH